MLKKILIFIVLLILVIITGIYFGRKESPEEYLVESVNVDFTINNKMIEDESKFIGTPKITEYNKVFVYIPYEKITFKPTFKYDNLNIGDLKWKIKSKSLDTIINGIANLNKYFNKKDNYLVSLCYNQRCISKWIYIIDKKAFLKLNPLEENDVIVASNNNSSIEDKYKNSDDDYSKTITVKNQTTLKTNKEIPDDHVYKTKSSSNSYTVNSKTPVTKFEDDFNVNNSNSYENNNVVEKDIPIAKTKVEETPIETTEQINPNDKQEKDVIEKKEITKNNSSYKEKYDDSSFTNNKNNSNQIGISIVDRCSNPKYVKSATMTIKPKVDLTLKSLYVYANDIGKIEITVTSDDGTNESIKVNLNPGKNQIFLSELYLDLISGRTYKLSAKALSLRESIITKIQDAQECARSNYSDDNISIKFSDAIVFFNIKYSIN